MRILNKSLSKIDLFKAKILLSEIQKIISDEENSDFDAVEKIVCLFQKNHIDFGTRHDFG